MTTDYVTISQACKTLGISRPSLMKWVEKGVVSTVIRESPNKVARRQIAYVSTKQLEELRELRKSYGVIPEKYLTLASAGNTFRCGKWTVYGLAKRGQIQSITKRNKRGVESIYVEANSLQAYLESAIKTGDFLDRFETAELLGVIPNVVQKLARNNRIPSVYVPRTGRGNQEHRLYPKDKILEFIQRANYVPELEPEFGYYLAGLTDGEGSFMLQVRTKSQVVQNEASFKVSLRKDDLAILVLIREKLGFGKIYLHKSELPSNPSACYAVGNHSDALKLVAIFDRFPLKAKKAHDYAIWRDFVIERAKPIFDQVLLNNLADKIKVVRGYSEPEQKLLEQVASLNRNLADYIHKRNNP